MCYLLPDVPSVCILGSSEAIIIPQRTQ